MTSHSYSIAEHPGDGDLVHVVPRFYVVSRTKLAVLFIATLGLYQFYWFYKNWSNYKLRAVVDAGADRSIWPVARALFAVFFTHALFNAIKAHGRDKAALAGWRNKSQATMLVVTMILANVLDRLSSRGIGSPVTDIASFLVLALLLSQFLNAQQMINVACGDPDGESNSRFTQANYVWIGLGAIAWILILIGTFLPE